MVEHSRDVNSREATRLDGAVIDITEHVRVSLHAGFAMRTPYIVVAILAAVALAAGACNPYHMYAGPEVPVHDLSTVTKSRYIRLMTIDGRDTGISQEFKLRPGEHTVHLEVYEPTGSAVTGNRGSGRGGSKTRRYVCSCTLSLQTEAGVSYHLQGGRVDAGWGAWVTQSARSDAEWPDVRGLDPPHCFCAGQ
jgi:hypothetical protein